MNRRGFFSMLLALVPGAAVLAKIRAETAAPASPEKVTFCAVDVTGEPCFPVRGWVDYRPTFEEVPIAEHPKYAEMVAAYGPPELRGITHFARLVTIRTDDDGRRTKVYGNPLLPS